MTMLDASIVNISLRALLERLSPAKVVLECRRENVRHVLLLLLAGRHRKRISALDLCRAMMNDPNAVSIG
jgi:hypothetical protein